jgi:hypothetical protein
MDDISVSGFAMYVSGFGIYVSGFGIYVSKPETEIWSGEKRWKSGFKKKNYHNSLFSQKK